MSNTKSVTLFATEYNFRSGDIGVRQVVTSHSKSLETFRYLADGSTEFITPRYADEARAAIVAFHNWKNEVDNG